MHNKKQKLSLYIECDNNDYKIYPQGEHVCLEGQHRHDIMHQPGKKTRVVVSKESPKGHLKIVKIELDGIELTNWPQWSRYVDHQGVVLPNTYGFMDRKGRYEFTIHQNAMIHNYLSYFLSCSQ